MNQKVIIIGGSSGLGRALAVRFALAGDTVGVLARREHLLDELAQQFPGKIFCRKADIADEYSVEWLRELIALLQGANIIILAASVIHFNPDLANGPESETIDINVKGFTRVSAYAWDYFKKQGGGQLVGISSIAAARGNKQAPAYHASKAYQSVYLESLRVKAKKEKNNIRITELVPGYLQTAMGKGDRVFWSSTAERAAGMAYRAIRRKRNRAFIPKRWWWVYHIQRLLPTFIYDWVVNGNWKTR